MPKVSLTAFVNGWLVDTLGPTKVTIISGEGRVFLGWIFITLETQNLPRNWKSFSGCQVGGETLSLIFLGNRSWFDVKILVRSKNSQGSKFGKQDVWGYDIKHRGMEAIPMNQNKTSFSWTLKWSHLDPAVLWQLLHIPRHLGPPNQTDSVFGTQKHTY